MVSVNRIRDRRSDFPARHWLLDSGAFTEVTTHGLYRDPPDVYAAHVNRWRGCGQLDAAVSQDYMCEPFALARTGLSVAEHQRLTVERFDALRSLVHSHTHVMPVLQGWHPADYAGHLEQYGERLTPGMWVGVGSVCKRNSRPAAIESVLEAIHRARPDLRLHGFGIKLTALGSGIVRSHLASADSMAWSTNARMNGRDGNSWREAAAYVERVERQDVQQNLFSAEG